MRVIVSELDIRKLSVQTKPTSVEGLIDIVKRELTLESDFTIQFYDPDFGGELVI